MWKFWQPGLYFRCFQAFNRNITCFCIAFETAYSGSGRTIHFMIIPAGTAQNNPKIKKNSREAQMGNHINCSE